jgi:tetratricopeptide (TPR) repeat protein
MANYVGLLFQNLRMPAKQYLVFFFILCNCFLFSQSKETADSLSKIIIQGADTSKIGAYNELAKFLTGTDDNKALELSFKALKLSKEIKYQKHIAHSYNRVGTIYDQMGKSDSAGFYFTQAIVIFEKMKDTSGLGSVYQNIGVMYYYLEEYDKSLENNFKALELKKKAKEDYYVAQILNNIGAVYRIQGRNKEAHEIYKTALELKLKNHDRPGEAAAYQNYAMLYMVENKYDSAFANINKAIRIYEEAGSTIDIAKTQYLLANIYHSIGNFEQAEKYLLTSIEMAEKVKSEEQLFKCYELMLNIKSDKVNDKELLAIFKNYKKYKDAHLRSEKLKAINKLQISYETEKKDGEIKNLNEQNTSNSKLNKRLYIIIALISVFLAAILFFYRQKRKANVLLTRQKKEIIEKTELLNRQSAEIARHRSQMNPHFVFNALSGLQASVLKKNDARALNQLTLLSKLMRTTLNNSDREWIPLADEITFLEQYVAFEKLQADFDFRFSVELSPDIDKEDIAIPPMLLQPLLENTFKHAQLEKVKDPEMKLVFKIRNEQFLEIVYWDNGKGKIEKENSGNLSKALSIVQKRVDESNSGSGLSPWSAITVQDLNETDPEQKGLKYTLRLPLHRLF